MGGESIPQPLLLLAPSVQFLLFLPLPFPGPAPSLILPGASRTFPAAPPFSLDKFPRVHFHCSSGSRHAFTFSWVPPSSSSQCRCSGSAVEAPEGFGELLLPGLLQWFGAGSMLRDPWSTERTSVGISGIWGHFNNPHKAPLRAWNAGLQCYKQGELFPL